MENKLTIKDSSIAFLSSVLLCQIGTLFFAVFGLIIASFFNITNEMFFTFIETAIGNLILSLFMDLFIICMFLFFNRNKNNKIFYKPTFKKISIYILITVLCYLLINPVVISFNSLIYNFFPTNDLKYSLTTSNYLISIISMAILPAIAEELLFRGIIFKGLQKSGNTFAIIISSKMFALFHLSLDQTIYPFIMGIILAVIMCHENNIIYCIIFHFLNNFLTLTLKYFNISLVFNHWSYYILAIFCLAIFIFVAVKLIKKLKNSQTHEEIKGEDKSYFIVCLAIVTIVWCVVQISTIFEGLK